MQENNSSEAISKFLLSTLPDSTRTSYELLSGFNYPINDYARLAGQIKQDCQDWDEGQHESADNILTHLSPLDFPIVSVQGTFEKYHVRLSIPDLSRYFPQLELFPEPVYNLMYLSGENVLPCDQAA